MRELSAHTKELQIKCTGNTDSGKCKPSDKHSILRDGCLHPKGRTRNPEKTEVKGESPVAFTQAKLHLRARHQDHQEQSGALGREGHVPARQEVVPSERGPLLRSREHSAGLGQGAPGQSQLSRQKESCIHGGLRLSIQREVIPRGPSPTKKGTSQEQSCPTELSRTEMFYTWAICATERSKAQNVASATKNGI